jgi:ubiquinone/menaquinone biosynthesis C-methylase UbiE
MAKTRGLSDKVTFITADGLNLPFEDHVFDSIIVNDAVEHVANPMGVLGECHLSLHPFCCQC